MKSPKLKGIILGALVIVLLAVWWDNLKLFYGNENDYEGAVQFEVKPEKQSKETSEILVFKSPKVNPFRKPDLENVETNRVQQNVVALVEVEKPSSRHKLLGVLKDKKKPQAVVNSDQGNTAVLSVSDSLENWVLIIVDTNFIVFRNEKIYDTLWLEAKVKMQ